MIARAATARTHNKKHRADPDKSGVDKIRNRDLMRARACYRQKTKTLRGVQ